MRRVIPAVGLFFLAPFVAEFLLGNISLNKLALILALAPMYGGGALLIREVTRRTGRGWPTILLLGLAYGIVEEALSTQSLFNPHYVGQHLLRPAYVPALGMGAWWTLFVLTLHTVWSIGVPIAMLETFTRSRRTTPWLGRIGLTVTAVLFVVGVALTAMTSMRTDDFVASVPQFVGAGVAVVVLVVAALLVGRRGRLPAPVAGRRMPNPWLLGAVSLVAGSVFVGVPNKLPWLTVGLYLVLYVAMVALVTYWSRGTGWGDGHRLALAGGALLTYAWHAFPQPPSIPADPTTDLVGNVVFAVIAVALLAAAVLRLRKPAPAAADATLTPASP